MTARPHISSWFSLAERDLSAAALRDYAAAGFTVFQTLDHEPGRWRPYSRDGNREALRLCRELGLGCLVADERLYRDGRPLPAERAPAPAEVDAAVADYRTSPALVGYLLYDEPSPHMFRPLAGTIARLRERDPGRTALIPLFPMHDDPRFPDAFEGRDYERYLREFVEVCQPDVLAYDYYPFFDPPARLPQYVLNFEIARRVARDAGKPLWYYAGVVDPGGPAVAPTPGRVRLQVNLALAYGARAILHFTYRSTGPDLAGPDPVTLAAVNREAVALLGRPEMGRVHAVHHAEPLPDGAQPLPDGVAAPESTVLAWVGSDAPSHLLVVNRDPERDRHIRVRQGGREVDLDLPAGGAGLVAAN